MPYNRYGRRSSFRGRRAPSRQSVWVRTWHASAAVPVSPTLVNLDLLPETPVGASLDAGARIGSTVMRVRGKLSISITQGSGFNGEFFYGVTVGKKTTQHSPLDSGNDYQWLTWGTVAPWMDTSYALGIGGTNLAFSLNLDLKSKRKITQPGESLILALQPHFSLPVANFEDYHLSSSVLVKLA